MCFEFRIHSLSRRIAPHACVRQVLIDRGHAHQLDYFSIDDAYHGAVGDLRNTSDDAIAVLHRPSGEVQWFNTSSGRLVAQRSTYHPSSRPNVTFKYDDNDRLELVVDVASNTTLQLRYMASGFLESVSLHRDDGHVDTVVYGYSNDMSTLDTVNGGGGVSKYVDSLLHQNRFLLKLFFLYFCIYCQV